MRTLAILVCMASCAYAQDPFRGLRAYVRSPYVLYNSSNDDKILAAPGQAPPEITRRPGKKKIFLACHVPDGEKADPAYREKVENLVKCFDFIAAKSVATFKGAPDPVGHGFRYQFDRKNKLLVHLVKSKFSVAEFEVMLDPAPTIRREIRDFGETYVRNFTADLHEYAFIIFSRKYGKKDGQGIRRWKPLVTRGEKTVLLSDRLLEVVGSTHNEQMEYLGITNIYTPMIDPPDSLEILPVDQKVYGRKMAAQYAIGLTLRSLLEALGCENDGYPHSAMRAPDWYLVQDHFGPRDYMATKPTYIAPPAMTTIKDWVE